MRFRDLVGLIVFCATISIRAEDWPRYHGPDNNGISKETGLLKSWPAGGPAQLWSATLGKGYSSASIANGRVFSMYQDDAGQWVVALDENTGKIIWKQQTGPKYTCGNKDGRDGPRCTPTVDGDFVYVIDGNGELVCLQAADGKPVWHKNILKMASAENITWGIAQSPFIAGEKLLVNPGGNMEFVALNKKTGEVIWKSGAGAAGYSTPVISNASGVEQVVFAAGKEIVGLRLSDGKRLWAYPWVNAAEVNSASPIAVGDMVFVSSGYKRGAAVFKIDLSSELVVTKLWENKSLQCHVGTPIYIDGVLYGCREQNLTCVDYRTGHAKWLDENAELPTKAQLTYADGQFYALGEKGALTLLELTPEGFKKISEMAMTPGHEHWAPVAIADRKLFVRDDQKLNCYDLKSEK